MGLEVTRSPHSDSYAVLKKKPKFTIPPFLANLPTNILC